MPKYRRIELLIIRSPKSRREMMRESPVVSDVTSAHAFFFILTGLFSAKDCGETVTFLQSMCPEGVYPSTHGDSLVIRVLLTHEHRTYEDFALHTAEILEHVYKIVGNISHALV